VSGRVDQAAARLAGFGGELAAVNKALAARKLEPVPLMTLEEWKKK
jgi:hypothetical protein